MRKGYYPDPEDPTRQRWWDGERWTSSTRSETGATPARPAPAARATAAKTPGEKAKERKRTLIVVGAAAVLLVIAIGFVNIVDGLGGPETQEREYTPGGTRASGVGIEQPYAKAAPPPPKSAEEIAASQAAKATAAENERRRKEAEAAAEFDRATYPALSEREFALLSKNPDASRGKKVAFYGLVTQFDAATGTGQFLADVGFSPTGGYNLNVVVSGPPGVLGPVVADDYVTIYGVMTGSRTYDNQFGGTTTAPTMTASIIDVTG